jgi:hypothetical protein
MLAWLMKTPWAIEQIEKWSYDYIKMDCAGDKCYGVLAVSLSNIYLYSYKLSFRSTAFASHLPSSTSFLVYL